jgi:benzoyl-CoA-dihydrodiol lyase
VVANSRFDDTVRARAEALAARSDRPDGETGIALAPLERAIDANGARYRHVTVEFGGPSRPPPAAPEEARRQGCGFWPLAVARELDDAILHMRFNEPDLGVIQVKTAGDPALVVAQDGFLEPHSAHWLMREILLLWKRVLKRIDVTSRSLAALIEPGSCFAGTLAELAFASDRSYMALGRFDGDNRPEATLTLSPLNFGRYPMGNGLSRLETRFLGTPEAVDTARARTCEPLDAAAAESAAAHCATVQRVALFGFLFTQNSRPGVLGPGRLFCCGCEKGFVICLWLAWRRPTLPGLEAQYHRR